MRHRRSGALEPRRRFILSGRQAFSAPIRRGTRVALAILSVRAESFSLNLSGELPSADGRRFAVPTAVGKRVDTCGFYPLNSRFPLFLSLAQTRDRRPLRNRGTAVGLPVCRGAHCASITRPIRSSRIPYCYTDGLLCAGAAYLCRATRLRVVMDSNYEFNLITDVTAGCADLQR